MMKDLKRKKNFKKKKSHPEFHYKLDTGVIIGSNLILKINMSYSLIEV